jgi:hypothetical protein
MATHLIGRDYTTTTTPNGATISADNPPTATTSKMSEGKAKGQGD